MTIALEIPDRPKTLTEFVADYLREQIIVGELDLGTKISEAKIANMLDISRTPVREAINKLEAEGLLVVEPQRGSFIFTMGPKELTQLCDVRVYLEAAALKHGIAENHEVLLADLEAAVAQMIEARDADDVTRYLNLDGTFHFAIINSNENDYLTQAYNIIAPRMSALRHRMARRPAHMEKSFRDHVEIVAAVKSKDTNAALKILHTHIDHKEVNYWGEIRQSEQASTPHS